VTSPAGTEPAAWTTGTAGADGNYVKAIPGATYEVRKAEARDESGKVTAHESEPKAFTLNERPTAIAVDENKLTKTDTTVTVDPTTKGQQYIGVPAGAKADQIVAAWADNSKVKTSADGEAITFDGLEADKNYQVSTRIPATAIAFKSEDAATNFAHFAEQRDSIASRGEEGKERTRRPG
jgi:hypothetical protein